MQDGGVRVNGERVAKPARNIGPGDVLTFVAGRQVKVVRIDAVGTRRGPASEARGLYTDLSAPPAPREGPTPTGRPDRNDRRRAILSKRPPLE